MDKTKVIVVVDKYITNKEMQKHSINITNVIRLNIKKVTFDFCREINKKINTYSSIMINLKKFLIRLGNTIKKDDKYKMIISKNENNFVILNTDKSSYLFEKFNCTNREDLEVSYV